MENTAKETNIEELKKQFNEIISKMETLTDKEVEYIVGDVNFVFYTKDAKEKIKQFEDKVLSIRKEVDNIKEQIKNGAK